MSSSLEPTPNSLVPHTTVGSVCDSSRGCLSPCLNEGEAGIEDENETVTVTPASCLSSCLLPRHDKKKKAHGSDMQTVVATARRALLMREVVDEAAFRNSASDDVEEQRCDNRASAAQA